MLTTPINPVQTSQPPAPGEGRAGKLGDWMKEKNSPEAIRNAAREFEAYFVGLFLQELKKTVHKNPYFHGGKGEEIFDKMLSQEQAKAMVGQDIRLSVNAINSGIDGSELLGRRTGRGIGIADMVEKAMLGRSRSRMISVNGMNVNEVGGPGSERDGQATATDAPDMMRGLREAMSAQSQVAAYGENSGGMKRMGGRGGR